MAGGRCSGSRGRGGSSWAARDAQDPPHRLAFQAEAAAHPTFESQKAARPAGGGGAGGSVDGRH